MATIKRVLLIDGLHKMTRADRIEHLIRLASIFGSVVLIAVLVFRLLPF